MTTDYDNYDYCNITLPSDNSYRRRFTPKPFFRSQAGILLLASDVHVDFLDFLPTELKGIISLSRLREFIFWSVWAQQSPNVRLGIGKDSY
jgi:hypothetical protein